MFKANVATFHISWPRGAADVLESAYKRINHGNKNIVLAFSVPSFGKNFDEKYGILDKVVKFSSR